MSNLTLYDGYATTPRRVIGVEAIYTAPRGVVGDRDDRVIGADVVARARGCIEPFEAPYAVERYGEGRDEKRRRVEPEPATELQPDEIFFRRIAPLKAGG